MKKNEIEARMKELQEQEAAAVQALEDIREQMAHLEDVKWAAKAKFIASVFGDGFDEFYRTISAGTKAETALLKPHMVKAVDDWAQEVAEKRMGKHAVKPAETPKPEPEAIGSDVPDTEGGLPENADTPEVFH